jgi:Helix-turn-helix domain
MGQAKDAILRRNIILDRSKGLSFTALSAQYGIGYNTVRSICHRYASEGDVGLVPRTANCGRRVSHQSELAFRLVRLISSKHSSWGIPYILTRLRIDFPDLVLQSERHYQRRIKRHVGSAPAPVLPKSDPVDRAREPHNTWQIDAKERLRFTDTLDQEGCFLNITDEKTSALLEAKSFPPGSD